MTNIQVKTSDQVLTATVLPKVACNNMNTVRLSVDFDSAWNGLTKSAVFYSSADPTRYEVLISSDGNCLVPAEVLTEAGHLFISVKGVDGTGKVKSSTLLKYKILPGTPSMVVSDPTADVYQQLSNAQAVLSSRMSGLEAAGTVDGSEVIGIRTGADGKVYATAGDAVREQFKGIADKNRYLKAYGKMVMETQGDFPYNDVDAFPPNSVITIGYPTATWLANRPTETFVGTVLTFNYTGSITGGMVQIAFDNQGKKMYTRCGWGGTNRYGVWTQTLLGENKPDNSNAIVPSYVFIKDGNTSYTSFNNLPVNKVFIYEHLLDDAPEGLVEGSTGTVWTFNFSTDAAGTVQLLFSRSTKTLHVRQCWGNSQEWTEWTQLATSAEVSALAAEVALLKGADVPLIASFLKIGCIGDSLASGESQYTKADGSTGLIDLYAHSWGQFMAKKYGIECVNFSVGGLSTRTWLTHSKGWTLAQEAGNICNAYIIGLGQNDRGKLGEDYLGTIADIDADNCENNADTFYGNYGKIIQRVKTLQPKAKFFLLTDPIVSASNAWNAAVAEIASTLSDCYLIDLTQYAAMYTTGGFFAKNKRGGHYNSIAYNYMGQIIGEEISKYMMTNPDEFAELEFIGTEYEA